MYELMAGKKSQAAMSSVTLCRIAGFINVITAIMDNIPMIQPLTAKDLKGTKGSRVGVISAPETTESKASSRNGRPLDHACLNRIPEGCKPKIRRMPAATQGNFLIAGLSSMGVNTKRSSMENWTVLISFVFL